MNLGPNEIKHVLNDQSEMLANKQMDSIIKKIEDRALPESLESLNS